MRKRLGLSGGVDVSEILSFQEFVFSPYVCISNSFCKVYREMLLLMDRIAHVMVVCSALISFPFALIV